MTPTVCVFNRTRESFLCLSAVTAVNSGTLAGEDGLWFTPSTGVYMCGAQFPVDRVYLDRGNRVILLVEHVDPLQVVLDPCDYASVLELKARTIYSSRTRVGDELLICSPEDVGTHWKRIQARVEERIRAKGSWTEQEAIACSKG